MSEWIIKTGPLMGWHWLNELTNGWTAAVMDDSSCFGRATPNYQAMAHSRTASITGKIHVTLQAAKDEAVRIALRQKPIITEAAPAPEHSEPAMNFSPRDLLFLRSLRIAD